MGLLNTASLQLFAGIAIGLASGIYALDGFGLKPAAENSGWQEWRFAPKDQLQPYALGHFLSAGKVPTPSTTHYYTRNVDDDGNSLRGDCVFVLAGEAMPSRWWSITAGDANGVTAKAVLSAGSAVLNIDGKLTANIARQPMPGNWIKPDSSGTYNLIYVISEPEKDAKIVLPTVKKGGC
jgi:hypothetical protein